MAGEINGYGSFYGVGGAGQAAYGGSQGVSADFQSAIQQATQQVAGEQQQVYWDEAELQQAMAQGGSQQPWFQSASQRVSAEQQQLNQDTAQLQQITQGLQGTGLPGLGSATGLDGSYGEAQLQQQVQSLEQQVQQLTQELGSANGTSGATGTHRHHHRHRNTAGTTGTSQL